LQHKSEAKHGKNTGRLLSLGLTNAQVLQGETALDFAPLAKAVTDDPAAYRLCYPNPHSVAIETIHQNRSSATALALPQQVIFIDASWRKALKMWYLNPWLQQINSWHFADPPTNQYHIRQTSQDNSLSTLESVAYVLQQTSKTDCSSLYDLLLNMQDQSFHRHKRLN
jgi:DTW domain-containing protein YfiP